MAARLGNPSWVALLIALAFLSPPASANPCGQQIVLASVRRIGAATSASVRRDQVRLQTFVQDASDDLLRTGFPPVELSKVVAAYQQNVPIYCLERPRGGPPSGVRNVVPTAASKEQARIAWRNIVAALERKYVMRHPSFGLCSDCKVEDVWKQQYRAALYFGGAKTIYMDEFEARRRRINFAKDHRALTSVTIELFLDIITHYAR